MAVSLVIVSPSAGPLVAAKRLRQARRLQLTACPGPSGDDRSNQAGLKLAKTQYSNSVVFLKLRRPGIT